MAGEAQPKKTTLAGYIEQMYTDWGEERKDKEIQWQEDLDNFMASEDSARWKQQDTVREKQDDNWKSKVFVRVVKEKVVMSYTFLNDLVLQGGQIPFDLKPNQESYSPEEMEFAQKQTELMRDRIRDQLTECKAERQFMKGTFSLSLYGETWVKSPLFREVQKKRWRRMYPQGFEGRKDMERYQQEIFTEMKPCIEYKSVWNMFMDPEYEDPQQGRGIIERDYISAYDLQQKRGKPGYSDEAILKVLRENVSRSRPNADTSSIQPSLRDISNPDRTILYLEFWGRVPKKYLEELPPDLKEGSLDKTINSEFNLNLGNEIPTMGELEMGEEIEITAIVCNETLVRVMINETDKRPYRKTRFEALLDEIHGIGTARNVVDAQQIINGAYRNIIDNIALSGNVIIGVDEDSLAPGQRRSKKLFPGKEFRFKQGTDIRAAFGSITIQNVAQQLIDLLTIAKQHADEESMIPRIMQGDVAPKKKPDTLGEINLLFQNAGKYMGQVVKNIDEDYLEPVIEDMYDYNMSLPGNEGLKGDFTVHAQGFNSFQTKVVKLQSLRSFLEIVLLNEALMNEAKFRPILEEMGKALDLDPDMILFTDAEKQDMAEMQKVAQEEEFQRQLQLARASLEAEAEVEVEKEDQKADNDLERELILEEEKSSNKIDEIKAKSEADEKKANNDVEREIIKQAAISKVAPDKGNGSNGASKKPSTANKPKAKSKRKGAQA